MESWIVIGLAVLVAAGVWYALRNATRAEETPSAGAGREDRTELYRIAAQVVPYFEASAHPADLLGYPAFQAGVRVLRDPSYDDRDLLEYYRGDNAILACMALEALAQRGGADPALADPILETIEDVIPWTRYFALRVLTARVPPERSVIGPLLARAGQAWTYQPALRLLREFVEARIGRGESPALGDAAAKLEASRAEFLTDLLAKLGQPAALGPLAAELRAELRTRVDVEALRGLGTVWKERDAVAAAVLEHPALVRHVAAVETALEHEPARSVLVVGEEGVGKTAVIHVAGRRLVERGWQVFEAGQTDLMAGMTYMGQLEERLRGLIGLLGGGRRVLWVVPDFHALLWAGRHQYDPSSVLDHLLPHLERGNLRVVGETSPAGYQRLLQAKPRCRTALAALRIEPLPEAETLDLAQRWIERHSASGGPPVVDAPTLREAWNLARQFLGAKAAPGSLLELLSITRRRLLAGDPDRAVQVRLDDLIATLSALTGLPASILDDRAELDLGKLRERFGARVMGQDEAVDCLVERVAMIKAGVTDPTRPLGVFLMAGPTGTGKTEVAKTLAEFLFGSAERMIRLDMSEFQDEQALVRIFGDPQRPLESDALVDLIRKQPFSVVLLDEFEKAHERVWDLFLQVFDDGRLTDRLGRTADFRHALILLTSNLGANIPSGLGLGFLDRTGAFSVESVHREVARVFRKELLNRLDRVLVFRPLSRDTMRAILRKELDEVFRRRGLRNRQWAVEWDDSAIEFLLEKGFTADLGARPLKRAIERHLLAPLARTIVDHRFPEGDQFLYVSSAGAALSVRFIDPDAPEPEPEAAVAPSAEPVAGDRGLTAIVMAPRGTREELARLRSHHDALAARFVEQGLKDEKSAALALTGEPGFWDSPDRHAVLGRVEYLDRIESGARVARSLLERLESLASRNTRTLPRDLVGRLAQQLWLLEQACDDVRDDRPTDAFLLVDAGHESATGGSVGSGSRSRFAERLGEMYRAWAGRRGMRVDVLEQHRGGPGQYRLILGVSGYAAFSLLEPENGLHVLELPRGRRAPPVRSAVRVRVVPQPESPADGDPLALARLELGRREAGPPAIVRRYREAPSPLVRDLRRGWRSGHLDRVLAGDFDVIG